MDRHTRKRLNTQIYEEACTWFVECRSGDLEDARRGELDRWLRKSPEHLSAYLEVAAIWNEGPSLDPAKQWDLDTLIRQAAAAPDNVVAFSGDSPPGTPVRSAPAATSGNDSLPPDRRRSVTGEGLTAAWRRRRPFALVASLAAAILAVGALVWFQLSAPVYATAIGEQRSIELADGSTVELNSRSKVRVHYSEQERAVDLLEGQALFHVAKDPGRPFIVTAEGTRVRAVGTQFDVYRRAAGTTVTVIEGTVAIAGEGGRRGLAPTEGAGTASTEILLAAGEQLTVTPSVAKKANHPNIAGATAWTQREIVFESASLAEVAEEFNRYNHRQLVIEDPDLYRFHISGVFSSTDPNSLIRFLRERPDVRVIEQGAEIRVAKK